MKGKKKMKNYIILAFLLITNISFAQDSKILENKLDTILHKHLQKNSIRESAVRETWEEIIKNICSTFKDTPIPSDKINIIAEDFKLYLKTINNNIRNIIPEQIQSWKVRLSKGLKFAVNNNIPVLSGKEIKEYKANIQKSLKVYSDILWKTLISSKEYYINQTIWKQYQKDYSSIIVKYPDPLTFKSSKINMKSSSSVFDRNNISLHAVIFIHSSLIADLAASQARLPERLNSIFESYYWTEKVDKKNIYTWPDDMETKIDIYVNNYVSDDTFYFDGNNTLLDFVSLSITEIKDLKKSINVKETEEGEWAVIKNPLKNK